VSFANPRAQQEFGEALPQVQAAFMGLSGFAPVVTSVIGQGSHAANSAHYSGRAIDVGAFGQTGVGFNRPTWDALTAAIGSGKFTKIGTFAGLYDNPQMQAWARANGVELFHDEGTGNHIHFEVDY